MRVVRYSDTPTIGRSLAAHWIAARLLWIAPCASVALGGDDANYCVLPNCGSSGFTNILPLGP